MSEATLSKILYNSASEAAPTEDKRFMADVQYVDGNIVHAIQRMRESVDNWYWQE